MAERFICTEILSCLFVTKGSFILSESDVILGRVVMKFNALFNHFQWQQRSKAFFTFASHSAFWQCKHTFNSDVKIRSVWKHGQVAAQGRCHWTNLHNGFLGNYVHYIVFGIRSGNFFFDSCQGMTCIWCLVVTCPSGHIPQVNMRQVSRRAKCAPNMSHESSARV